MIINDIITQTISGVIVQLPLFILLYLCARLIAKEIRIGIKNIPSWISQYQEIKLKQQKVEWARGIK